MMNFQTQRSLLRTLPAVGLLLAASATNAVGAPQTTRVLLDLASVSNLTGDPLVTPTLIDSLFPRLFTLETFAAGTRPTGGQGLGGGYFEVPNPFASSIVDPGSASAHVTVDLELEQTYYGPVIDTKSDLVAYWAFGLLAVALRRKANMAVVQWRATLRSTSGASTWVCVGQGASFGDPLTLARRTAVYSANKRALYDLAYAISTALAEPYGLQLKRTWLRDGERAFQSRVDAW